MQVLDRQAPCPDLVVIKCGTVRTKGNINSPGCGDMRRAEPLRRRPLRDVNLLKWLTSLLLFTISLHLQLSYNCSLCPYEFGNHSPYEGKWKIIEVDLFSFC